MLILTTHCRVILGLGTAIMPVVDVLFCIVPMYSGIKVALVVYLWSFDLEGSRMVYEKYVSPVIREHEPLVDHHVGNVKESVSAVVSSNISKVMQYIQKLVMKTLAQNIEQQNNGGVQLKAESPGKAAPAASGYRSDSFKSASSFASSLRSFSVKDE